MVARSDIDLQPSDQRAIGLRGHVDSFGERLVLIGVRHLRSSHSFVVSARIGGDSYALERKRHCIPPSATDVRLDGDEVAPDADDGDAGHATGTYICPVGLPGYLSFVESTIAAVSSPRTTIAVMMRVSVRGPHPT